MYIRYRVRGRWGGGSRKEASLGGCRVTALSSVLKLKGRQDPNIVAVSTLNGARFALNITFCLSFINPHLAHVAVPRPVIDCGLRGPLKTRESGRFFALQSLPFPMARKPQPGWWTYKE